MSTQPNLFTALARHTFGREHLQHPPLPQTLQQGQFVQAQQMGQWVAHTPQTYASQPMPADLDHIVRSVGEW